MKIAVATWLIMRTRFDQVKFFNYEIGCSKREKCIMHIRLMDFMAGFFFFDNLVPSNVYRRTILLWPRITVDPALSKLPN